MIRNIADYLNPEQIAFLDVETRGEAIEQLIELIDCAGKLEDRETFCRAIKQREEIVSTGIGMGVAIPHAKLSGYQDFFIGLGILKKGVDWDALDGIPVRLVFMIGGPDDRQTQYLQILSGLTQALKSEERRKKMLTLNSKEAIINLFKEG